MRSLFSGEAFAVLHVRNFRYFLLYRICATMASLMMSVIVGWQVYEITKDVLWLGLIGLFEVVPQIGVSLFAGHYIDIWNRRTIVRNTLLLLLLSSAILLGYSIYAGFYSWRFGAYPIFITIFITGFARGILAPAQVALLGQMVPRNLYANAATWNSATWQASAVMGPAIGGMVYGFFGVVSAYSLSVGLFLVSLLMIAGVRTGMHEVKVVAGEKIFTRIREGINFVFRTPELLGAFSLDMFAVLFGGAVAMLPVFASDVLHVGPQGLGLLRACPAIGATIMAFLLMFRPPVKETGRILFISVVGFGLCMITFALSKNFWLSAVILVLSGGFDNVSVVIRGTILQLFTPDEMRGRVASVNSIFIGSSNELGAFESGLAAKIMGLVPSVIFGGAMTLIVVFVTERINKPLRKLSLKDKM
ncbi:MAG TPA: MFS transporter [Bacteroidales bacterium]|nr:MFS transporter [Bacteroidales bacterium]